ncbi:hypothetical protein ACWD5A_34950, partial [Streptomyces sp. NPDC002491]
MWRSTPTVSPCTSTGSSSRRLRPPNCPWHSATSCSETEDDTVTRAALLVLADGRFPAGGHAHSGGAEEAVKAGRITGAAGLEAFCR